MNIRTTDRTIRSFFASREWLAFLFFLSGCAALVYQIVWQRQLFAAFGVNIESVTVVVSIFMFGLGVGSLLGGKLSETFSDSLPELFLICEIAIGLFGLISIPLIQLVSSSISGASIPVTVLATFAVLLVPTAFMGATLPILVTYLNQKYQHIGKSVSLLYCLNTLGSATACFITVHVLFVYFSQQSSTIIAALLNLSVGVLVILYARSAEDAGE